MPDSTHDPTRWSHSSGELRASQPKQNTATSSADYSGIEDEISVGIVRNAVDLALVLSSGEKARTSKYRRRGKGSGSGDLVETGKTIVKEPDADILVATAGSSAASGDKAVHDVSKETQLNMVLRSGENVKKDRKTRHEEQSNAGAQKGEDGI